MKLCKDCTFSIQEELSILECYHPSVVKHINKLNTYSVRLPTMILCQSERLDRRWTAPCGVHGKLFQPKSN